MNTLGWIGNLIIVTGMLGVAHKWRPAFLIGAVGNTAYLAKGCLTGQPDLVAIELLVIVISLYSWWMWRKK